MSHAKPIHVVPFSIINTSNFADDFPVGDSPVSFPVKKVMMLGNHVPHIKRLAHHSVAFLYKGEHIIGL